MSFLSPEFALLALLFFPIYWILVAHSSLQKLFLLIISYLLYATWSIKVVIFLFIYSSFIWLLGNWVQLRSQSSHRLRVGISIIISLLLLFVTKYYDFFREQINTLLYQLNFHALLPAIDIITPIGISFFTFQAITYLVWKNHEKVTVRYTELLLYLTFWPTLFAGPIMRAKDFHEQVNGDHFGKPIQTYKAIYLIFLGLFQKMVIASWLGNQYVDPVFKYPDDYFAVDTFNAIIAYTLQIFLDFSGYTLIVTGFGLFLGFVLPKNFAQPYLSTNLKEFWRRWHMSLSSFIRDYLYIPLGGNRDGFLRSQCNIFIAMLSSGVWHGVGMGFILWGIIHGLGMIVFNVTERFSSLRIPKVLSQIITLLFVSFAWVFFRATSIEDAINLLSRLIAPLGDFNLSWVYLWSFSIVFILLSQRAAKLEDAVEKILNQTSLWHLIPILCLLGYLIIQLSPNGIPAFIYYQF